MLASELTGLPDSLVALVGRDQVTAEHILGVTVPEAAQPVLRALPDSYSPAFRPPPERKIRPARPPLEHGPGAAFVTTEFSDRLARMLGTKRIVVHADNVASATRRRLNTLRANGILDESGGFYRATDIALYGTFGHTQLPTIY